jgi:transcriptional regulator with XRE-family HTH domain
MGCVANMNTEVQLPSVEELAERVSSETAAEASVDLSSVEELAERVSSETAAEASVDLVPILGANLRRLRVKRGLSLERLAKLSGVSRAMLSQVELAYSAPTINVIWRIAHALEVPFGALLTVQHARPTQVLPGSQAKILTSHDASFTSRALFPLNAPRRTEFYEVRILPKGLEKAAPHAAGTVENLVVAQGSVLIAVGNDQPTRLDAGDAIMFHADVAHSYENPTSVPALLYLVMQYAQEIGS